MKKRHLLLLIILFNAIAISSCKNGQSDDVGNEAGGAYFSIVEYLQNEKEMQQPQAYVLLKVVEQEGKVDSTYVDANEAFFDELTTMFKAADISDKMYLDKYIVEESHDFANALYFINYFAADDNLLTQKLQLSLFDETSRLVSVYMETHKSSLFKTTSYKFNYNTEKSVIIQEYKKSLFSDAVRTVTKYYYNY